MPATYEPIATTTLSSSASSFTFSSIPGTYTDIRLVIVPITGTTSDDNFVLRFNGDTTGNTLYSMTKLSGNGTTASSSRIANDEWWNLIVGRGVSSTPTLQTVDLFSYAGSTYKTGLITNQTDNNGSGNAVVQVGLYRSTSAITQITVSTLSNNLVAGTTATLYGIKNA
jgi:hypothetical protein